MPNQSPSVTLARVLPAAILSAVWLVFLALGVGPLLIPPVAALMLIFVLFPYRHLALANRTMIASGALALLWLLAKVQTILWIAGLGLFTAYVLNPLVVRLQGFGISRPRASLYLILVALAVVITTAVIVLPDLYSQAASLVANLPGYLIEVQDRYRGSLNDPRLRDFPIDLNHVADALASRVESLLTGTGQGLADLARRTGAALSIAVLTPIVGFHLLKDLPALKAGVMASLPRASEKEVAELFAEMDILIGRWLRGQFIVAGIIGTLTSIGLTIVGIRYSIVLGFFAGLMNLVPIIGYWLSLILAVVVALTGDDPMRHALLVAVVFFSIQLMEQNFISPKIVGRETGLHPVAILLSLLVFGALAGLPGALFAIPFTLILRVFYHRYISRRLREARLPES